MSPGGSSITNYKRIMETSLKTCTKNFIASALMLLSLSSAAQKGKLETFATPKMQEQINAVVKPVTDQLEKLCREDRSGTYARYTEDVKKWKGSKNPAENREWSARMTERYGSFFKEIWSKAQIDEKLYQSRIRALYPEAIRKNIRFQPYLNYTITASTAIPHDAPPASEPQPEKKCIDVCPIATVQISSKNGAIGGGNGDGGNCFLKSTGWAAGIAGVGDNTTILNNNITIPGTFPADKRMLHVRLTYFLKQEASSFGIVGTDIAYARHLTYASMEELEAISIFFFVNNVVTGKQITEEYLIPKSEVSNMNFNALTHNIATLIGGAWSSTECSGIKWTVCEE